ncbi:MAG: hypothetical protein JW822_00650 [Spirochaetales bacterium]|nr:hypothetical protein [Spirochaetales bacterium]
MKTVFLVLTLIILPGLFLHASLIKVTVDAASPPAGFSRMFSLNIKYENNLCLITITYDPKLKEKITEKLPDGSFIEYYSESGIQSCYLLFYNDQNFNLLTAPVCFTESNAGRNSATVTIQKDLLKQLRIQLYIPNIVETFCYELLFLNVD